MKENKENRIQKIRKRINKFIARLKAFKKSLGFLAPMKELNNFMYFVIGLILLYGFIVQFLGWV